MVKAVEDSFQLSGPIDPPTPVPSQVNPKAMDPLAMFYGFQL